MSKPRVEKRPRPRHRGRRRLGLPRPRLAAPRASLPIGGALALIAASATIGVSATTAQAAPAQAAVPARWAAGSVTESLAVRALPVSRDSQRQALDAAVEPELRVNGMGVARQQNAALTQLRNSAENVARRFAKLAWQLPLPPGSYRLTARFGEGSSLWVNRHTGLDFAAPAGTPIYAVTGGRIKEAAWAGSYGLRVVLTTAEGTELYFCHMSALGVRTGQKVRAGEVIGAVGTTGNSTGNHLHLEVRPGAGDPVDPFPALIARGVRP